MRVVLQRVSRASVRVDGVVVGSIGSGLVLLVGVASGDDAAIAARLARKCFEMRVFRDDAGRFDRSLGDERGQALVISQFTLLGDVRKGRRPSFTGAATPDVATVLIDVFVEEMRTLGATVETGQFGETMEVELVNDGPVTIVIDSIDLERPRGS